MGRLLLRSAILSLAPFVLVLAQAPHPCLAGAFVADVGCDTLSTSPLRLLDRIVLFDDCSCRTLCRVVVEPYSYQGSAIVPILGGVGTSELACSVDSTQGTATFTPSSCVITHSWSFQGTGVIVGAPDACFQVTLWRIEGYGQPELICFRDACTAPTPTEPLTWGALRATYR